MLTLTVSGKQRTMSVAQGCERVCVASLEGVYEGAGATHLCARCQGEGDGCVHSSKGSALSASV